jgi:hypothetical protein
MLVDVRLAPVLPFQQKCDAYSHDDERPDETRLGVDNVHVSKQKHDSADQK